MTLPDVIRQKTIVWSFALFVLLSCGQDKSLTDEAVLPALPEPGFSDLAPDVLAQFADAQQNLAADPQSSAYNKHFARLLHAYSLYAPASVMYERCELLSPDDIECLYLHSLVYRELGKDKEAIDNLQKVITRKATHRRAAVVMGDSLLRSGNIDEAMTLFKTALTANTNTQEARYGLAMALIAKEDYPAAKIHLEKLHEGSARYGSVYSALASIYRQERNIDEIKWHLAAAKKYATSKIPFKDAMLWDVQELQGGEQKIVRKADTLFSEGKYQAAASKYLEALELNPRNDDSHANLVGIFSKLGHFQKAQEHYEQAIALNAQNILAYKNMGVGYLGLGNYSEAASVYSTALSLQPDDAEIRTMRAYSFELAGKDVTDTAEYRRALSDDPTLPLANYLLARHLQANQSCEEAIPYFEKSVRIEEAGTAVYMADLVKCYLEVGQNDEALSYYRRASILADKYKNIRARQMLKQINLNLTGGSDGN